MAKIFLGGDVVNQNSTTKYWTNELQNIIKTCDYSICNFEGPIESSGSEILKSGPHIAQKKESIGLLKELGFNLLLLANNHIFDYGKEGLNATLNEASNNNVSVTGAGLDFKTAYEPFITKINGVNIAIINACEAQFGVLDGTDPKQASGYAWINHWLIDEAVINSKKIADAVIVCSHAGLEDYSIPLIEWSERYKRLCDLGADCIIGSHPHVPQGFEIYNKKPIFYSLGNFYFDSLWFKNNADYSFSVILTVAIRSISFELIYHHKENGRLRLTEFNDYFSINQLNKLISDDKALNYMYLTAYKDICRKYLKQSISIVSFNGSIFFKLKRLMKYLLFRKEFKLQNEILLMHLFRNESIRWVLQRAIILKSK